jgi:hypothetical protein
VGGGVKANKEPFYDSGAITIGIGIFGLLSLIWTVDFFYRLLVPGDANQFYIFMAATTSIYLTGLHVSFLLAREELDERKRQTKKEGPA